MLDVILDTIIDALKIIPFLFIAFLLIELFEHKFSDKNSKILKKSGVLGPLLGSVMGVFPQCGFSVLATNLYVTRIISLGTLISVYLSTSDEMLPILISKGESIRVIISILGIKVLIGIISGFIIDFFCKKETLGVNWEICDNDDCHCEEGIVISSLKHTFNTIIFIMFVSFILNIVIYYGGEEILRNILGSNNLFSPFIASLIGLIPNCCSSVILTELYLSNVLSLSNVIAGLLTNSGVALLVLFKTNKNKKENIKILLLLYFIGVISGLILNLLGL